jgi:hypothetical protein
MARKLLKRYIQIANKDKIGNKKGRREHINCGGGYKNKKAIASESDGFL